MRLYHGSNMRVERPRVDISRPDLDFGRGFYLTSHFDQAKKWARRRADWSQGVATVNLYEFDENWDALRVLRFGPEDDAEWVEFVCSCRRGGNAYLGYDLIIGDVADDKVFMAVQMYFDGLWDMPTTLSALKFFEKNDQYCIVTQSTVDRHLRFIEAREV